MARGNVRAGGTGLQLGIDLKEVDQSSQIFRDARNRIARELRTEMVGAATEIVVPSARRRAGRLRGRRQRIAENIVARKGTGNTIYLTTGLRGMDARIAGLFEFGGTVHTPIRPRRRAGAGGHAPAIMTPYGPRAAVLGPRHYHGEHFLERARDEKLDAYAQDVRDRLVTRFEPLQIR
jgi:hypothetical protein